MALRGLLAWAALAGVRCIVRDSASDSPDLGGCHGHRCLERWLAYNDHAYRWRYMRTLAMPDCNVHQLELNSLRWPLGHPDLWQHALSIAIPNPRPRGRPKGWATLILNDYSMTAGLCTFARETGAVVAHLSDLPERGVDIIGNGTENTGEEYLKARSWREYCDHPSHPEYCLEMADAKATSRAMDAIEAYSRDRQNMPYPITKFIVAGASKRAIAAYTACALDRPRVRAIVPQIITLRMGRPALVPRPGSPTRKRALEFSGALLEVPPARNGKMEKIKEIKEEKMVKTYQDLPPQDFNMNAYDTLESGRILNADGSANVYDECRIPNLDTETAQRLYSIVDPYWYIEKLTCGPILVQNCGNDMWFGADDSRQSYPDIPNATFQMNGPSPHQPFNPGHMETMKGFVVGVVWKLDQPKIRWTIDPIFGHLEVELISDHIPIRVTQWLALGPERFCSKRFQSWTTTELTLPQGSRVITLNHPGAGPPERASCQAMYVSVDYEWPPRQLDGNTLYAGEQKAFRITTEVSVMPNDGTNAGLYYNRFIDVADSDLPLSLPDNPLIYIGPDWESHRRRRRRA